VLLLLLCVSSGKDVPSPKAEYSMPDVVIGLTVLSFRYTGLRRSDFRSLLRSLQESLYEEVGPFLKRPSSRLFADWVRLAGGHVRGSTLEQAQVRMRKKQQLKADEKQIQKLLELQWKEQQEQLAIRQQRKKDEASIADVTAATSSHVRKASSVAALPSIPVASPRTAADRAAVAGSVDWSAATLAADVANAAAASAAASFSAVSGSGSGHSAVRSYASDKEVWPLRLVDVDDEEQFDLVYNLLHKLPELVYHYLRFHIFPQTLKHQGLKLSASGQDVGGNILADHRVGFSGTPSDLLPLELGECQYERGSDGAMLYTLCNPSICSVLFVPSNWNVRSLLDTIAQGPYHALIDTGALITGMTNYEVASYLLEHGLPTIEGVVFLDGEDRKMILLRRSRKVIPLASCGLALNKRFCFYDQIHTTGMDIAHTVNALAALTIGVSVTQNAHGLRGERNDVLSIISRGFVCSLGFCCVSFFVVLSRRSLHTHTLIPLRRIVHAELAGCGYAQISRELMADPILFVFVHLFVYALIERHDVPRLCTGPTRAPMHLCAFCVPVAEFSFSPLYCLVSFPCQLCVGCLPYARRRQGTAHRSVDHAGNSHAGLLATQGSTAGRQERHSSTATRGWKCEHDAHRFDCALCGGGCSGSGCRCGVGNVRRGAHHPHAQAVECGQRCAKSCLSEREQWSDRWTGVSPRLWIHSSRAGRCGASAAGREQLAVATDLSERTCAASHVVRATSGQRVPQELLQAVAGELHRCGHAALQ
jgi:hypothetical protein